MIDRNITPQLRALAGHYPVVALTGPRQSGKTTLCRAVFPDRPYVSLEALDLRAFAQEDPRGFLAEYQDGAVLDEIQRVPGLLSYLQTEVDERPEPGRFILTGSQHLGLSESIAQSLAGRCGLLTLLPPSLDELTRFPNAPDDLYTLLWQGAYPRIYDRGIPAHQWLADYLATYVQRDVRQIVNVGDLQTFSGFLRLCAGRSAQEVNLSALGADAGVSHNTARAWLSVLETSFVLHRLPAWHANLRKQLVKAPKLHLFDSGLLCYLLGIQEPAQLRLHPLRGAVFESWAVAEVYKAQTNQGPAACAVPLSREPRHRDRPARRIRVGTRRLGDQVGGNRGRGLLQASARLRRATGVADAQAQHACPGGLWRRCVAASHPGAGGVLARSAERGGWSG